MLGALAGDIIGSRFEHQPVKIPEFPLFTQESRFTDDSVLTVAVAEKFLFDTDLIDTLKSYHARYPQAGYGDRFSRWAESSIREPYNSWGNGSAMRVSPVGYVGQTIEEVLDLARSTAEVTHNHPEGIKGAQATAAAIFLARTGAGKETIKAYIESQFQYSLEGTIDSLRPGFGFDPSCQGTVPPALIAFMESDSFEDAIRKAISLGGDSDTLACITGGIAQAFYREIPDFIVDAVYERLDPALRRITTLFGNKYDCL